MVQPSVRVRHLKNILAAIGALPDGARVLARLPTALVASVEEAHGADWLPVEQNVELVRALVELLGPRHFHDLSRELVRASFDGPLFGTLVRTARRLFDDDPASWARWIPHGWALVFRGCGKWQVAVKDGEAILTLVGLPAACASDIAWIESVAASLSALLDLLDRRGAVTLIATSFAGATYALRWEEAAAAQVA